MVIFMSGRLRSSSVLLMAGTTRSSTPAAPTCCPASSRRTSICARRCSAAIADDMPLLEWLRTPRLADGSGAHARDAARVGAARRRRSCCCPARPRSLTMETVHDTDVVFEALDDDGTARRRRQVHDGLGPTGARAAAGADARVDRRERRAAEALGRRGERPAARGVRAAVRGVVLARAARGGRGAVGARAGARPHARVRERATKSRSSGGCRADTRNLEYLAATGPGDAAPVHGALRLGHRRASRRCSPSATSRSCTAPART